MRKQRIIGAILLVILLVMPMAFAAVAPNKGSEVSAQKVADVAKTNANAAFNRGASFTCPIGDGWASSENYCLYTWFG